MFSQKKKTLREIHKLYLLLKPFLPEKEEQFLIHEVIKIMESISPEVFTQAMKILYGRKFIFKRNPGELALKFVEGLKESGLFAYIGFVKSLHG